MVNIKCMLVQLLIRTTFALYEGDNCVVVDPGSPSKNGKCTNIHECEYAKMLLQSRKKPQTCGFIRSTPLVCCPSVQASVQTEAPVKNEAPVKSEALVEGDRCKPGIEKDFTPQKAQCVSSAECDFEKNFELTGKALLETCTYRPQGKSLVCCPLDALRIEEVFKNEAEKQCLKKYDKDRAFISVSQGEKATSKEFPHMASIGYKENNQVQWFCGGSLISDSFILTAAHCTYFEGQRPNLIRLGDLDLESTTDDAAPEDVAVTAVHVHPEYKSSSHYHDIALLKLAKSQKFTAFIQPACLFTEQHAPLDLQAIGWGKTSFTGPVSSHLSKVSLKVTAYQTCAMLFNKTAHRKLKNGIIDELQLCAGGDNLEDTCPGDSGGPLHYYNTADPEMRPHFVIVGVTSFGKGCGFGTTPGVYTRLHKYIPWIEGIVWSN